MKIEYGDGGNLYLPATRLEGIQKYAGAEAKKPKLNKLGGGEWSKTKTRVKGAVQQIAKDLVQLYAARQSGNGFPCGPDTVWQKEFEELFPDVYKRQAWNGRGRMKYIGYCRILSPRYRKNKNVKEETT